MELKGDGVVRNKNLKAKKKTKEQATLKNMMDHCDGAAKNKNLKADETEKPIVVSLEEAVAKMKPSHLADFLNVRSVPNLDLLIFYFHFESAFDQVSWTWVKMFKESPLSTLINVPLSHISKPLYEVSVDWIKQHPIKGFSHIVSWTCDPILKNLASGGDNALVSYWRKSQVIKQL
ncbi:unnamed protein product [Brassica oleracea]|uniref:(rape) hypothetical protein n=1 Tax=Brassica napus TaxID=3708 RepID=A0A816QTV6_BRANA|nr:unnamed protein product [Brassica napus]